MKIVFCYLLLCAIGLFACQSEQSYDLIIRNGSVYDGSLSGPTQTDIVICGDRIVRIGELNDLSAKQEIDAADLAVAPGFIDLHAHLEPLLRLPEAESHV